MNEAPAKASIPQGLVSGIVSCVCGAFAFFIPILGLILATVGVMAGLRGLGKSMRGGYTPGITLNLIGSLVSGIALILSIIAVIAIAGLISMGAQSFGSFR